MIDTKLIPFLTALKENNHKLWFDEQRSVYENLRNNFKTFCDLWAQHMSEFDNSLAQQDHKSMLFRINRDVRFSKDKSPYKTSFSAYLSKKGKKYPGAGYYFHFEPGNIFMGAGIWMPEPQLLKQLRQEIDYNLESFMEIVHALPPHFAWEGETIVNAPKGYTEAHPAIAFLKMKSLIVITSFKEKEATAADFVTKLTQNCKTITPLVHFINQVVDNQEA